MSISTYFTQWSEPINAQLLEEELRSELGDVFVGLVIREGEQLGAHFDDSVEPVTQDVLQRAMAVLEAHDWQAKSAAQQQDEAAAAAAFDFRQLVAERIAWHEQNKVTAGNAVQVAARIQAEWAEFLRLLLSGRLPI